MNSSLNAFATTEIISLRNYATVAISTGLQSSTSHCLNLEY